MISETIEANKRGIILSSDARELLPQNTLLSEITFEKKGELRHD